MSLDDKPFLQILDNETRFQSVIFMKVKSAENLWNDFVNCWASLYTEFRNIIRLDRDTSFNWTDFKSNIEDLVIYLKRKYIEVHNSIGQLEHYHHSLRRILDITRRAHSSMDNNTSATDSNKSYKRHNAT